jgi:uncharacterized damage-inducible protein DinB
MAKKAAAGSVEAAATGGYEEQLLETWAIHDRMNQMLLAAVSDDGLAAVSGRGRTVGEQFAHLHNVRLMWLRAAAPELGGDVEPIERGDPPSRAQLAGALAQSASAISALLRKAFAAGRVKSFKPHPAAFLGYLISHESHHRGQITLTLKLAGAPIDRKVLFGLWEWGTH